MTVARPQPQCLKRALRPTHRQVDDIRDDCAGRGQAAATGIWNTVRTDANTLELVSNAVTGQPAAWDASDPYRGPGGEVGCQASRRRLD